MTPTPATRPGQPGDGDDACRGCGCTDADACPGGCFWIEPDLCSECASTAQLAAAGAAWIMVGEDL